MGRRRSESRTSARRRSSSGSRRPWRPGRPIRDVALEVDEEKAIRGFRFLTQKPVLVLLNVGEADIAARGRARSGRWPPPTTIGSALVDALSAKIEMELGELEPDEAAVFMEELGIAESGLDRVIGL